MTQRLNPRWRLLTPPGPRCEYCSPGSREYARCAREIQPGTAREKQTPGTRGCCHMFSLVFHMERTCTQCRSISVCLPRKKQILHQFFFANPPCMAAQPEPPNLQCVLAVRGEKVPPGSVLLRQTPNTQPRVHLGVQSTSPPHPPMVHRALPCSTCFQPAQPSSTQKDKPMLAPH